MLYRRRLQLAVGPELDVRDDAEPARPRTRRPRRLRPTTLAAPPPVGRRAAGPAGLTAIDLALLALRDRFPRRARR